MENVAIMMKQHNEVQMGSLVQALDEYVAVRTVCLGLILRGNLPIGIRCISHLLWAIAMYGGMTVLFWHAWCY